MGGSGVGVVQFERVIVAVTIILVLVVVLVRLID